MPTASLISCAAGLFGGGFRSLQENQRVEFEVKQGPKGLQAANIRPL